MHKSRRLRNYKAEAKATSIELELQLTQIHVNWKVSLQFHVKLIGHAIGNHIDTNQKLMHRLVHGDFDKDKGSGGLKRFHCKSKEHMPLGET